MSSDSAPFYSTAVGFLLLLATLFFVWTLTPPLSWLLVPAHPLPPRLWLGGVFAVLVLLGASTYLRETSLLWQVPLQAAAFALIVAGLEGLFLRHALLAARSAAICAGYLGGGVLLGLWMRKLQDHFLKRRRRPPTNRWRAP